MINFDNITKDNIKEHNPNWPQIPGHPCRILTTGDSGFEKTISLFNLISEQPHTEKICFYNLFEDPYEAKSKLLINKRESRGWKHFYDSKAYIECLNYMDDIYKNIEEYNLNKNCKILIVFEDLIADIPTNKKGIWW